MDLNSNKLKIFIICIIAIILIIIVYKLVKCETVENFESILNKLNKNKNKLNNIKFFSKFTDVSKNNSKNNNNSSNKIKNSLTKNRGGKYTFDDVIRASEDINPESFSVTNIYNDIGNYYKSFYTKKFKNKSNNTSEAVEKFGLFKDKFIEIFK